jgi:hypothetical protein
MQIENFTPMAIAFIFSLRSLEEIEAAFPGNLHEALTRHFVAPPEGAPVVTRRMRNAAGRGNRSQRRYPAIETGRCS